MPALNIADLNNGKKDLDHIAEVATSKSSTATDRTGGVKPTVSGAINSLKAFNFRGAFAAGVAYAVKDVYTSGGVTYAAAVDHVSTTVAADLAAGKVVVHQLSVDADGRVRMTGVIVGTEELGLPARRDAYVVGRAVEGATDCHAFSDRTVIDNVTDAGTYGSFDATAELNGAHVQNHMYAFQDRMRYRGSGTLQNSIGFYSSTIHSGTGTVDARIGMMIDEMAKTGGGTITSQIGVLINPLTTGANNVALNILQAAGWAMYAPGGAKSYHKGALGIGVEPANGVKLQVQGSTNAGDAAIGIDKQNGYSIYSGNTGKAYHKGAVQIGQGENADGVLLTVQGVAAGPRAYVHSTSNVAQFGAVGGDYLVQFVTNGAERLEITSSSGSYTVRPGLDNSQPLGDVTRRWSVVCAGSSDIITSDATRKQQRRALQDAERRVAVRLRSLLCAYKFNDAVEAKGEAARIHVGIIAQEAKAAFEAEGLVAERYAVLCYDKWDDEFVDHPAVTENVEARYSSVLGEDGKPFLLEEAYIRTITPAWREQIQVAGDLYGIRYEELLAFILAAT